MLSSGEIINANAKEHPDLFRSLKGGTNNFGVVTSFDIIPIKFHDLWYKGLSFPATDYQAVLPAIAQTQINMESDDKAGIIIQARFGQIQVTFLYAEHVRASPATFAPLDTLNGNVTIPGTNSTALNFSRSVSAPEPPGSRAAAGVTSLVDVPLYISVFEQFLRLQHYSSSPGTGLALVIQQFGAAAVRAGIAQNNNSLGLAAAPQNWWSFEVEWLDAADEQVSRNTLLALKDYTADASKAAGKALPFIFANTGDLTQDVTGSYGAENLERMKRVSLEYDSEQLFQKAQYGWLLDGVVTI